MSDRLPAVPARPLAVLALLGAAAWSWWHWRQVAPAIDAETAARLGRP